jgi:hypothetical protein
MPSSNISWAREGGVGVGVVAAHHHQRVQAEPFAGLSGQIHLLAVVDFGAAGLDHGEAAHVAVAVHQIAGDLDDVSVDDAVGPHEKTVQPGLGIDPHGGIIQPGNHIVPARRGAAGEDDADFTGFGIGRLVRIGGRIHAFDPLDAVADDVRQLSLGLFVDVELVLHIVHQACIRLVEDIAHRRLVGQPLFQFQVDVGDGIHDRGVLDQFVESDVRWFRHSALQR